MKKLSLIFVSFLFSFSLFADCKVDTAQFYLLGKEGVRDWDASGTKLIQTFPKLKQLTSPYEAEYDLYTKIKSGCEEIGKSEVHIFRMIGKRTLSTTDNDHDNHGKPKKAEWDLKPVLVIQGTVKKENGHIIIPNLPVRKLLEEKLGDDQHVWKLKVVFKGDFNPSPTVVIIDTPLLH